MRYDVRRGIRAPLLLVAALGLLAAACSSGSGNGSSSSSGGPETSTITLGSLPVVDAAPAYIADKARPGFSGVFVMPNSPIKTPADLAGKKIAVNTLNNVGGLVISAVLQS